MDSLKNLIAQKQVQYGLLICVFLIVVGIGLYMGLKSFSERKKKKESVYKPEEVWFTLYYVTWCPHSIQTKPIFEAVEKSYEGAKTKGGLYIKFKKVDCTDESTNNQSTVNGKVVSSFPTIYFDDGINDQVEFMSKCEINTFKKFIEDMTGGT